MLTLPLHGLPMPSPIVGAGLGFSKTINGNLELIHGLQRLRTALLPPMHRMPVLAGPSRKSFLSIAGR